MSCNSCLLLVLIFQFSTFGVHALDTCSNSTLQGIVNKTVFSQSALSAVANTDIWFVLVTKDDAQGVESELLSNGAINADSTLDSNFTVAFSNGSSTTIPVHIVQKLTYLSETQPDGEYQTHTFPCSSKLTGNYRCKTEGASGQPLFDVLVSTKYSLQDLTQDLVVCKKLLALVSNGAEFTQLSHP